MACVTLLYRVTRSAFLPRSGYTYILKSNSSPHRTMTARPGAKVRRLHTISWSYFHGLADFEVENLDVLLAVSRALHPKFASGMVIRRKGRVKPRFRDPAQLRRTTAPVDRRATSALALEKGSYPGDAGPFYFLPGPSGEHARQVDRLRLRGSTGNDRVRFWPRFRSENGQSDASARRPCRRDGAR